MYQQPQLLLLPWEIHVICGFLIVSSLATQRTRRGEHCPATLCLLCSTALTRSVLLLTFLRTCCSERNLRSRSIAVTCRQQGWRTHSNPPTYSTQGRTKELCYALCIRAIVCTDMANPHSPTRGSFAWVLLGGYPFGRVGSCAGSCSFEHATCAFGQLVWSGSMGRLGLLSFRGAPG